MSEKRHATLDAKSTDTYQKRKKAREEKQKDNSEKDNSQKLLWKKSASLESLQMIGSKSRMGPEEREAIRNAYVRANSVRVSRNRGCNESFRAAVDRSYEKDFPETNPDFAIEDLGPEDDDCFVDHQMAGSHEKEPEVVVMRRSKSERDTPSKKKNRNSKLFRGLGTMFRIGTKPSDSGPPRRSKSSSSTNRKSLAGPEMLNPAELNSSDENNSNRQSNTLSASELDYRQNFLLSKSRSGDLAMMSSRQQQQHPHHQKRQAPPPPPFLPNQLRAPGPNHPHHQQQQQLRKPGEMYAYEYFPSAMMRPGSRVGIADPAQLSTESADYDVIQRLQHRPSQQQLLQQQQQQQLQEQPHPMRYSREYNPGFEHLYGSQRSYPQVPPHHGVHLGSQGLAQVHMRSGSNLSSGSSTQNNLNTSGGSSGSGKTARPKSNFYEYELYSHHHPQHNHFHYQQQLQQQQLQQQQQQQQHPLYSIPRGSANMYQPNS